MKNQQRKKKYKSVFKSGKGIRVNASVSDTQFKKYKGDDQGQVYS